MNNKRGFTLMEMLAVIVVLLLLFGMTLKLFPVIGRASARAETAKKLQHVAFAINEYYAEYGTYPPTDEFDYFMEDVGATKTEYPGTLAAMSAGGSMSPERGSGLLAYLLPCPMKGTSGKFASDDGWVEDTPSDKRIKQKWAAFIDPVIRYMDSDKSAGGDLDYCIKTATVTDGWDRSLKYVSPPPFNSYKLWSTGANAGNAADDIYSDKIE